MRLKAMLLRCAQIVPFIVAMLFFCGCGARIYSVDQASTVTVGEHTLAVLDVGTLGPPDGGTHAGNIAVLIPTDWSVEGMDLDGVEMSIDDPVPTSPTSTPSGYKWSFWHTPLIGGGSILRVSQQAGITTGTFTLQYYPGVTHCDDDGVVCEDVVWGEPVTQEVTVTESYSGPGLGTNGAPYKIITCGQLELIDREPAAFYQLKNDIDCSDSARWNGGQGFDPISDGFAGGIFSGSLNGDAKTISRLFIHPTSSTFAGLFGVVAGGIIQNFTIDHADVAIDGVPEPFGGVGAVVGVGVQPFLRDVHVTNSTIRGSAPAGGLIGFIYNINPLLDSVYTKSNIAFSSGENNVIESTGGLGLSGGLAGLAFASAANDSFSSSTVVGSVAAGGLFGGFFLNQSGADYGVIRSYAMGVVSSTLEGVREGFLPLPSGVGGLIGSASSAYVASSFSTASLFTSSTPIGGGIVGAGEEVTYYNTYFDAIQAGQTSCEASGAGNLPGCDGVNTDGLAPDFFKHTAGVPPFVGSSMPWDFDRAWEVGEEYPVLRNLMVPPRIPVGLHVDGDYNVTTTVAWTAPVFESGVDIDGYYVEYTLDEDWLEAIGSTVYASTTLALSFPPDVLRPGSVYHFRVRSFHGGPYDLPVYGLASDVSDFTTSAAAPPEITDILATPSAHGAVIRWATGSLGSTQVVYSTDESLSSSTTETDLSPRVTNHVSELTELISCTTYQYAVSSTNAFALSASSSIQTFTTTGCVSAPTSSGGGAVGAASGGVILSPLPIFFPLPQSTMIFPPASSGPVTSVKNNSPPTQPAPPSITTVPSFKATLKLGVTNDEVKKLQIFLNTHGFILAKKGPGSPGNETNLFGPLSAKALAAFQEAHANQILKPLGLKKGTGIFAEATRKFINGMK